MTDEADFAQRLLSWFDEHGRHDLPWQNTVDPYAVWVSEIMLQQTQVATVIPYYQRFMASFPDIHSLANASDDEVLEHWAGLGYYSRARNLHKSARLIQENHFGQFPEEFDQIVALPGIGPSTAGAILAFSRNEKHAILDGNVKRVLTRFYAIDGWAGATTVQKQLWQLADECTPDERVSDYTQAIMDLGATLCTRSKPRCDQCPFENDCMARRADAVDKYPGKKPKKIKPVKQASFLIIQNDEGAILLIKRPPTGIWGGLWSLPECSTDEAPEQIAQEELGLRITSMPPLNSFRHTFSHYHLDIQPVEARLINNENRIHENNDVIWLKPGQPVPGLPAPVKKMLKEYL